MTAGQDTTATPRRREDPRVRRAEFIITLILAVLATVTVVTLGVFTDLPTLLRLGTTLLVMVLAYPLLRLALYPRGA
ncbi:hypothetical protein [Micrococcus luteus]|uniref:hypothetical protein n=1 Tax=Micrococcus luteus TaxID=1270 RepID=UPI00378E84D1